MIWFVLGLVVGALVMYLYNKRRKINVLQELADYLDTRATIVEKRGHRSMAMELRRVADEIRGGNNGTKKK